MKKCFDVLELMQCEHGRFQRFQNDDDDDDDDDDAHAHLGISKI